MSDIHQQKANSTANNFVDNSDNMKIFYSRFLDIYTTLSRHVMQCHGILFTFVETFC